MQFTVDLFTRLQALLAYYTLLYGWCGPALGWQGPFKKRQSRHEDGSTCERALRCEDGPPTLAGFRPFQCPSCQRTEVGARRTAELIALFAASTSATAATSTSSTGWAVSILFATTAVRIAFFATTLLALDGSRQFIFKATFF